MNIKEVEARTGITKQNIRYYEKQGLLTPERNRSNDYRQYSEKDIHRLLCIKVLRKLDMPIEMIRNLLDGNESLQEALDVQKKRLLDEKKKLEGAIAFCDIIDEDYLTDIIPEIYLEKMEMADKDGNGFFNFIEDYKKVAKAEQIRSISFMPDTMCETKEEFTLELFKYADQHNLNLIITKEGMYPEFTIDGVEYSAYRQHGRYGAIIHCEAKNQQDYIPEGMKEKRYRMIRALRLLMLPIGISFFIFLYYGITTGEYFIAFFTGIGEFFIFMATYMIYKGIYREME